MYATAPPVSKHRICGVHDSKLLCSSDAAATDTSEVVDKEAAPASSIEAGERYTS